MTEIERKWTRERFLRQSQGGCAFYEAKEEGWYLSAWLVPLHGIARLGKGITRFRSKRKVNSSLAKRGGGLSQEWGQDRHKDYWPH